MIGKTSARLAMVLIVIAMAAGCAVSAKGREIAVSGTIRIVGNEPFTSVVIRSEDPRDKASARRDTLVTGPLTRELRENFQGKSVTLIGSECASPSPQFRKCIRPEKIMID